MSLLACTSLTERSVRKAVFFPLKICIGQGGNPAQLKQPLLETFSPSCASRLKCHLKYSWKIALSKNNSSSFLLSISVCFTSDPPVLRPRQCSCNLWMPFACVSCAGVCRASPASRNAGNRLTVSSCTDSAVIAARKATGTGTVTGLHRQGD